MINIYYNIEKVVDLNHIRSCVISVFSKSFFLSEDESVRLIGVLDDISLMVLDGNIEHLL